MAPPVPSPQSLGLLPMGLLDSTCIRGCLALWNALAFQRGAQQEAGGREGRDKTGIRGLAPWVLLSPAQKAVGPLAWPLLSDSPRTSDTHSRCFPLRPWSRGSYLPGQTPAPSSQLPSCARPLQTKPLPILLV